MCNGYVRYEYAWLYDNNQTKEHTIIVNPAVTGKGVYALEKCSVLRACGPASAQGTSLFLITYS